VEKRKKEEKKAKKTGGEKRVNEHIVLYLETTFCYLCCYVHQLW